MKGLPPPDPLLSQEGEAISGGDIPLLDNEGAGNGGINPLLGKEGGGGGPIHNKPDLKTRRKSLRNEATPAEQKLWSVLQHSQLNGYKFRRQHSVGYYILDFYCPSERLAVELDGDSHFTAKAMEYDSERTAFLNSLNIRVLRFFNTDVYNNLVSVCEMIIKEIRDPSLPPLTPPKIGGAQDAPP